MLGYVAIVQVYVFLILFRFFIQDKERPAKSKLFLAKLHALLGTSGSSENLIVDSTQCQPILDLQKIFEFFRNFIIWILNSLEMKIFEYLNNCLTPCSVSCVESDSEQANTALSLQKRICKQTIFAYLLGAQMASFQEIKQ